jgi:hypothetical protein
MAKRQTSFDLKKYIATGIEQPDSFARAVGFAISQPVLGRYDLEQPLAVLNDARRLFPARSNLSDGILFAQGTTWLGLCEKRAGETNRFTIQILAETYRSVDVPPDIVKFIKRV